MDDDKIEVTESAMEELKSLECKFCKNNLQKNIIDLFKSIAKKEKQYHESQLLLFRQDKHIYTCPFCKEQLDVNEVIGRKVIGKFRVKLSQSLPNYFNIAIVLKMLNEGIEDKFYVDFYMYV